MFQLKRKCQLNDLRSKRPQLADSCHNLVEFGRDGGGGDEGADYVIPAGGVREGLAGKMVVLRRAS